MRSLLTIFLFLLATVARGEDARLLPGALHLEPEADRSARMVEGISRWLERETLRIATERSKRWEGSDGTRWGAFREARLFDLWSVLGTNLEGRAPAQVSEVHQISDHAEVEQTAAFSVHGIRWPGFEGTHGEGLLLTPKSELRALVIAIPDADQIPESFALARDLAQQGCAVVIPTLADRSDTWSGKEELGRFTNQPHREWLYRQLFEVGRTVIGLELEKVSAAVDALLAPDSPWKIPAGKVGVVGYGEGGLLALHYAALDARVQATLVSGYFGPRERLYEEPIYRSMFGLLREFGDAELAGLIAPRGLVVEHSTAPDIKGPPAPREDPARSKTWLGLRAGAAPGIIKTPELAEVAAEVARANKIRAARGGGGTVQLIKSANGKALSPGSPEAKGAFLAALGVPPREVEALPEESKVVDEARVVARQKRTVREMEAVAQREVTGAERIRRRAFGDVATERWAATQRDRRARLECEVIGKIEAPFLPPNPRARVVRETEKWTAHEVVLDVLPEVFAWGWLLVPKDIQPDEKRPVVVCQHGLEGLPEDTVNDDPKSEAFGYYKAFAAKLAERGFIAFAPHNPYRGKDKFRMLQRRANPLGLSLFSFIVAQHDVATQWLASLPFVDPKRIAFYGLSYGGKTAMRVPALLPDRYCLSICSGDFNEWIRKNVSIEESINYPFTNEWEMPEWNLAAVANYAEMAMLIAPRPFMVERGHDDGVGLDEWVAYEYAKVRRGYVKLGIGDRTEIEWFNGPHTIHGVGTFEFLHKHLAWPAK